MERAERIELSWPAWKAGTHPISHARLKYNDLLSVVKEHTTTAARGRLDPYSPNAPLPDLSAVRTHWSGTPDSNRESHDPKSCGLSRFPSARKKAPVKSERAGLSTGPVMRLQRLSHTGLRTFTRIKGIDARWFRGLRHCPEMDSLYHHAIT